MLPNLTTDQDGAGAVPIAIDGDRLHRRLLIGCLCDEIVLLLLDGLGTSAGWIATEPLGTLFDLDLEDGLGSWFQATQTFMAGVTLWLIALVRRGPRGRLGWPLLAVFFLTMSADDGAAIHERIGAAADSLLERLFAPSGLFPGSGGCWSDFPVGTGF